MFYYITECGCEIPDHEIIVTKHGKNRYCPFHGKVIIKRKCICQDCKKEFETKGINGEIPERCPKCARSRQRRLSRENNTRKKKLIQWQKIQPKDHRGFNYIPSVSLNLFLKKIFLSSNINR
jgi:hypothetical protein